MLAEEYTQISLWSSHLNLISIGFLKNAPGALLVDLPSPVDESILLPCNTSCNCFKMDCRLLDLGQHERNTND